MRYLRSVLLWLMAAAYVAAGVNHFVNTAFYVDIMPPYLPWHRELVYLSGAAEIVLGIAVLIPRLRRAAGWGLVALLVAVFPANLHMALNPERYPDAPEWGLWLRLPVQGLLIAWALWATRPRAAERRSSRADRTESAAERPDEQPAAAPSRDA